MVEVNLITIGILAIIVGFILVIVGSLLQARGKAEWAFGGFIGSVPFGWASREEWLKLIIIVSTIFLLVFVILNLLGR